jgi:hypothetical protein
MSAEERISELIGGIGESVLLRRSTVTGGDAWNPTTTSSDTPVNAVVRAYRPRELLGILQQGDREVRIAAADLASPPTTEDHLVFDGKVWTILAIDTRKAAGSTLLHILTVRA